MTRLRPAATVPTVPTRPVSRVRSGVVEHLLPCNGSRPASRITISTLRLRDVLRWCLSPRFVARSPRKSAIRGTRTSIVRLITHAGGVVRCLARVSSNTALASSRSPKVLATAVGEEATCLAVLRVCFDDEAYCFLKSKVRKATVAAAPTQNLKHHQLVKIPRATTRRHVHDLTTTTILECRIVFVFLGICIGVIIELSRHLASCT